MEMVLSHPSPTHPTHTNTAMINTLTAIFLTTGLTFHLMAAPGGDIYTLLFRGLSLIPVVMAIVINYPKFQRRLETWRAKRESKRSANRIKKQRPKK